MSRKFKKLSLQYSFLKLEKEEVEEISAEAAIDLERSYREKHGEFKFKPKETKKEINTQPESESEPKTENNGEKYKNKDLKRLYRKIASATHPDKTGNVDKSPIFDKAARAYENNNLAQMLDIAGGLNIEILELSQESIILLENNIKNIVNDISTLKGQTAWHWANAKTDEDKNKILDFLYNFRHGDTK